MKIDQPANYYLHLFLLRLWREQVGQELFEWRGEVRNPITGEVRYFRDGAALYNALCRMADDLQQAAQRDAWDQSEEDEPQTYHDGDQSLI